MTQNTSSAVMQQRSEADDSLDDFPSPPWSTRALCQYVLAPILPPLIGLNALEPCCNRGFMAKPMAEYFDEVFTSDVHHYGWDGQQAVSDFLFPGFATPHPLDLVIANPPFRLAQQFIEKSLAIADLGCAMLVRTSFQEGVERYRQIFRDRPPTVIAQFAERVIMHKGILRDPSKLYWNPKGKDKKTGKKTGAWQKPSTATSYCWMVWLPALPRMPSLWIPPCRRQLERPGDYPMVEE